MDDSEQSLTHWKEQQERNRAARLRQLYSEAELWRKQQQDLGDLARLRPDLRRGSIPKASADSQAPKQK